jgi:hypothetical protein
MCKLSTDANAKPAGAVPGPWPVPMLLRGRHSRKRGAAHFAVDKARQALPHSCTSECVTMSQSDAKRCGGARYQ